MPFSNLPKEANDLWEQVYNASKKKGDSEEIAARKAWAAVKSAGWSKGSDDKWHKKAIIEEQFLTIKKAYVDAKTGERRWRADTSNTSDDLAGDNMTLDLFNDFVNRIEQSEPAPEEFRSNYWEGGMPYLSISHYPDLNGEAVPGVVDAVYVDGTYLKAKGRMNKTPLGDAAWKSICEDLDKVKKGETSDNKVRISIGFLDYAHKHKSNGVIFDRKSLEDICKDCIQEVSDGTYPGRAFYKGLLVHFAMTRVPMNLDTSMNPDLEVTKSMTTRKEDAATIIGEELASEIDKKAKMENKALITKSEDTEVEEPTKPDVVEEANMVDLTPVLSALAEIKSLVGVPAKTVHVLDEAIEQLKSKYDEIVASQATPDDKLKMVQQPFNELGTAIVNTIKTSVPETENKSETTTDVAKAFSDALQPLMQKMDLLIAQQKPVINPVGVPARRSLDPALVQTLSTSSKKPMSIDEIARRSVGLTD